MTVEEKIVAQAKGRAGSLTLQDFCIGVGYTGVKLSDGSGGVSYTFRDSLGSACGVLQNAGKLQDIPVTEALDWALSENLAQASIGVATVNALMNRDYTRGPNIAQAIDCTPEDVVGMVGWFCPLVWRYQEAKALYVFERDPESEPAGGITQLLPSEQAYEILPRCNKVVLTGTSFINKTADSLLAACRNASEIIVVGASTPMCPSVLKEYGITVLAGTKITDADRALRIVAQGGGGMDLSPASEKLFERI